LQFRGALFRRGNGTYVDADESGAQLDTPKCCTDDDRDGSEEAAPAGPVDSAAAEVEWPGRGATAEEAVIAARLAGENTAWGRKVFGGTIRNPANPLW